MNTINNNNENPKKIVSKIVSENRFSALSEITDNILIWDYFKKLNHNNLGNNKVMMNESIKHSNTFISNSW